MGWSSGKCQISFFASCPWTASLASFFSYLIRWHQTLDLSGIILKKHSRRWKRVNTSFAMNGANMRAVVNPPHQVSPLFKNDQAVKMSVAMSEKTRATLKAKNFKSSHQRWHLDSFPMTGAEKDSWTNSCLAFIKIENLITGHKTNWTTAKRIKW